MKEFKVICIFLIRFRHKLIRVRAENVVHLSYLRQLQTSEKFDFWTDAWRVGQPIDIHVYPNSYDNLASILNSVGIQHHTKVEDIGQAVEVERQTIERRRQLTKNQKAFDFENYHSYDEV